MYIFYYCIVSVFVIYCCSLFLALNKIKYRIDFKLPNESNFFHFFVYIYFTGMSKIVLNIFYWCIKRLLLICLFKIKQ